MAKSGWVYTLANRYSGGMFVGVIAEKLQRMYQELRGTNLVYLVNWHRNSKSLSALGIRELNLGTTALNATTGTGTELLSYGAVNDNQKNADKVRAAA